MSSFDEMLADCNDAFQTAFGEKPTADNAGAALFRPHVGAPRWLQDVIIDRNPPEKIEPGQRGSTYTLQISVRNDPVIGIDITTFDPGVDKIDIPLVLGGPLVTRNFSSDKAEHDGGRVSLKVR